MQILLYDFSEYHIYQINFNNQAKEFIVMFWQTLIF